MRTAKTLISQGRSESSLGAQIMLFVLSGNGLYCTVITAAISTAIPPLLLIQEEQLSVTGERMCTKYW